MPTCRPSFAAPNIPPAPPALDAHRGRFSIGLSLCSFGELICPSLHQSVLRNVQERNIGGRLSDCASHKYPFLSTRTRFLKTSKVIEEAPPLFLTFKNFTSEPIPRVVIVIPFSIVLDFRAKTPKPDAYRRRPPNNMVRKHCCYRSYGIR
ncbi:hypothetical protein Hypma_001457 [Hypsizygus marmoreus]|uniref:Uncharacterized protein n=1 Tax=Hypsizygus marmoreus TaxID=39966 RepID=A0A369K3V5_HYPMA|nr:hypothetical protein Hypma_001457 [Hypsizygus marmoreus]